MSETDRKPPSVEAERRMTPEEAAATIMGKTGKIAGSAYVREGTWTGEALNEFEEWLVVFLRSWGNREVERLAEQRRDQHWSAALETGFSDCPPRNPDEVTGWWARHFAFVESSSREAENARRDQENAKGVDGLAIRERITACPENVDANGHCECSGWVASQLSLADQRGREEAFRDIAGCEQPGARLTGQAKQRAVAVERLIRFEFNRGVKDGREQAAQRVERPDFAHEDQAALAAAIRALPSEPPK